MHTQTSAALAAADLVKTYKGGRGAPPVRALDGLSFAVEPGTVFALLGPNGAGKSTTVKVLTTLSRPDSGSASVAGIDVLRAPDAVRRPSAWSRRSPPVTPWPPAGRTSCWPRGSRAAPAPRRPRAPTGCSRGSPSPTPPTAS